MKVATGLTEVVAAHPIKAGVLERLAHRLQGVGRVAFTTGDRCGEDLTGKLIFTLTSA
jgi:hypothetical protein